MRILEPKCKTRHRAKVNELASLMRNRKVIEKKRVKNFSNRKIHKCLKNDVKKIQKYREGEINILSNRYWQFRSAFKAEQWLFLLKNSESNEKLTMTKFLKEFVFSFFSLAFSQQKKTCYLQSFYLFQFSCTYCIFCYLGGKKLFFT